ncbi:coil containing protein [Vibrio phage 2.275.O._10N.286.54.E11]|nr:coil containing protein [Vibrio phage 2.275.O._10N.286.54.E11]
MDQKDLQAHKEVLLKDLQNQVDELTRIAKEAEEISKTYFKHLPKIHIYNERKADLKKLLRDYGYQGKVMESMIHRPSRDDTYINENGGQMWLRHQCQYLLYSEDKELNEELQVTLTLDETDSEVAYIIQGETYRNFYGDVTTMTEEQINKLTFSQKLESVKSFTYSCQRKISDIDYRKRAIQSVGSPNMTSESVQKVLDMLRHSGK